MEAPKTDNKLASILFEVYCVAMIINYISGTVSLK